MKLRGNLMYLILIPALAAVVANPRVASAASIYNFDSDTPGTVTPFVDTNNGLAATFGGGAAVCDVTGFFDTLSGNALIQNLCVAEGSGPLSIAFGSDVSSISFDFATAGGANTDTLTAFEGMTTVGSATFSSTVPGGGFDGEGFASLSGVFNSITFSSNTGDLLAIDNVNATATPEPSTLTLLIAPLGLASLVLRRRFLARRNA